jgi:hypothetical protein
MIISLSPEAPLPPDPPLAKVASAEALVAAVVQKLRATTPAVHSVFLRDSRGIVPLRDALTAAPFRIAKVILVGGEPVSDGAGGHVHVQNEALDGPVAVSLVIDAPPEGLRVRAYAPPERPATSGSLVVNGPALWGFQVGR